MIPRHFRRSLGQRQHLAVLVGLLIATFALTAVMTWQAHGFDVQRRHSVGVHLHDAAGRAAREWSERLMYGVHEELVGVVRSTGKGVMRRPGPALDALAEALVAGPECSICASGHDLPLFSVGPDGAVESRGPPLPPGLAASVWRRVEQGAYAWAHDSIGVTLLFRAEQGRISAVGGVVALENMRPARFTGFLVPESAAREFIRQAFPQSTTLTLAGDIANTELFTVSASVDGVPVFGAVSDSVVTKYVNDGPVWGITLGVAVAPGGRARVVQAAGPPRLPLLLGLLLLIGLVIVSALLLVRREADLVRLRADFVSSVSHELRTPLAQIRMFTETLLLGRVRTDGERRRSLEIIDQEARRLSELVENVLLFSKSESGRRVRLTPEPTPFAAEVRRAVESFLPMCRARDADVRLELQEDIEAPVDRSALRQIMVNLIDNALKYGPTGQRITVGVALFGSSARVWVDDEGPGIPRADRERAFESFVRLRRDADEHVGGSGIGLSVVLGLARLHGGSAWAEEAPGGGTRIVVQFPDATLTVPAGVAAAS